MFRKLTVMSLFLAVCSSVLAECKGVWEIHSLASTQKPHTVVSDMNLQYVLDVEFLSNLDRVHKKIDRASGIETRLLLCNSDASNVYSWKEGDQNVSAITLGLTRALGKDYDAYAAVLAHENAHLTQNHTTSVNAARVGEGVLEVMKKVGKLAITQGTAGISFATSIASIGVEAFSATFSPAQESEADFVGLRYLMNAGYSHEGIIRLHEKLTDDSKVFKIHPSSSTRITELKDALREMGVTLATTAEPTQEAAIPKQLTNANKAIGTVVTAKPRLGYYIVKQAGQDEPVRGMRVRIKFENGEKLEGTIQEVSNGFFSVSTESPFTSSIEGASVTKSK
jgi:hypothetical protein